MTTKAVALSAERVMNAIRESILTNEHKVGERLSEVRLAGRFGTSRSPIREALQRLAGEGLVRLVPRRGAFVATFEQKEIRELFEIREAIDGLAARLAAIRGEPMHIQRLTDTLDLTRAYLSENGIPPYPLDLDFHQKVLDASGNARLASMAHEINLLLRLARLRSWQKSQRAREALEEHELILEAIKAREPEEAEARMRRHIQKAWRNLTSLGVEPETGRSGPSI